MRATVRLAIACCLVEALAAKAMKVAAQAVITMVRRKTRNGCHSGTNPKHDIITVRY